MDVVVQVGGWEHECCGAAIERDQLVDLGCLRTTGPDGQARFTETHHLDPEVRVRGRVSDIQVVRPGAPVQAIHRLPSGQALRGFDAADDGHLEEAWTGEPVPGGDEFLLVVQVSVPAPVA